MGSLAYSLRSLGPATSIMPPARAKALAAMTASLAPASGNFSASPPLAGSVELAVVVGSVELAVVDVLVSVVLELVVVELLDDVLELELVPRSWLSDVELLSGFSARAVCPPSAKPPKSAATVAAAVSVRFSVIWCMLLR
mgnify:CR=1 FL=1